MSTKLDATLPLHVPSLEEVAKTLQEGLSTNFETVNVNLVECPDLTQAPFYLSAKGLGGTAKIVDVGGVGYLMPTPRKDKVYNLKQVCETCGLKNAFVLGAGAGPTRFVGINSEMVHNCQYTENALASKSHVIFMKPSPPKPYTVDILNSTAADEFTLMANLILTEGIPGQVIKVEAKKRTGKENFVTCMRLALAKRFGNDSVGMGGFFVVKAGKVNMHIMPELPETPFVDEQAVDKWLNYFDMEAPLICASVFVSHDPGLDLRIEHTHCYSNDCKNGGHYHYDTTPDDVDYEGYFTLAQTLYRIDKP